MIRMSFPRAALAAATLTALVLAGCKQAPAPLPEPRAPVLQGATLHFAEGHPHLALLRTVEAVSAQSVQVDLPARLVWNEDRTQRIYPAFAGRVSAILADVGSPVKPGTPLANLASPDFGQAQADAARAQVDVRVTSKALARQRELFEAGIVARKDFELAEGDADRALAESQRAAARTRLYGGGATVDQQLALRAGVSGVVVERNLNPGQELRPDQPGAPLFVISDPTSLWVQIDARETEVGALQPGTRFTLTVAVLPGVSFEGKVASASDFIDPASRTLKVRGVIANPDRRLKAEMLGTARFSRALEAGAVLPSSAVTLRGNAHYIYVQTGPGNFEQREVAVLDAGPKQVLVTRGLAVGDKVVSENALLLAAMFRAAQDDAQPVTDPASAKKP